MITQTRALAVPFALTLVFLLGPVTPRAGAATAPAAATAAPVSVFPRPGDHEASPTTTIGFRGIAPAAIGPITVRGAVSGHHTGSWVSHSDGRGASFRPNTAFAPGEVVTVATRLAVRDATNGTFTFTVAHPSPVQEVAHPDIDVPGPAGPGAPSPAAPPLEKAFRSRPDIHYPTWQVTLDKPGAFGGLIAVTPRSPNHSGPILMDTHGRLVWEREVQPFSDFVSDAKLIHYKGHDDLAYWSGQFLGGHGNGAYHVVDDTYADVGTIDAGNGYHADLHDLQITPSNTALVLAYNPVAMDLRPYGGPADGTVLENVVQEIDLTTNAVLFEWHSLDDIPVTKSVEPAPTDDASAWDYLHGNGIELDTDGNLLLSARHTWGVYKIDRNTGHLVWTLGKGGDFTPSFPASDWFQFQHDVRRGADHTLSVFDDGFLGAGFRQYSRGLVMSVNEVTHTVSIVRALRAPTDVLALSQGSFRELGNGNDLIGWGQVAETTEYHNNHAVLDLRGAYQSYRAVLVPWHGHPSRPPDLAVEQAGNVTHAFVSWNGATDVATWVLRTGPDASHLTTVATEPKVGFETELTATTNQPTIVVEAHDAHGALLGQTTSVNDHTTGYWLLRGDGAVRAVGTAASFGNARLSTLQPLVGIAAAGTHGYWVAQADGSVLAVATRGFGSLAGRRLAKPIVGIAATPDGHGYWLVGADGGVFTFGTARFAGSLGGRRLTRPIVGMVPTPDGHGYWLVGADGGVFSFGNARFAGSLGGRHLNGRIVGIAATPDGHGYWLVGADGGVFTFGTARFAGSLGGRHLRAPIIAIARTGDGRGYWLAGRDGTVTNFGDAANLGTGGSTFAELAGIATA